jgi:hypothetical protein
MKVFTSFIYASLAVAVVCGGYWVAGFDFNQRNPLALACYVCSVIAAGYVFAMSMAFQHK